ncbi:MAG: creatininase family protein [Planctomycetaceae bacterium]
MCKTLVLLVLSVVVATAVGFQAAKFGPVNPDPKGTRPIEALETVFVEDMTWMEVRDAMQAGKDTVLVATGGIEQNGPYLAANKHQVVLRGTTDAIARKLGNTLVAPLIGFVPEGDIDPPTSHMKYPSTVSLTEDTYRRLLVDVCSCYRTHGFKHVVLIGDSGGNQEGLKAVAAELNAKWQDGKTKFSFIPEYYNYGNLKVWLEERGIKQTDEGLTVAIADVSGCEFFEPKPSGSGPNTTAHFRSRVPQNAGLGSPRSGERGYKGADKRGGSHFSVFLPARRAQAIFNPMNE